MNMQLLSLIPISKNLKEKVFTPCGLSARQKEKGKLENSKNLSKQRKTIDE